MTLSDNSIKNPVFAWMLMAGMIIFGVMAFLRLGISFLPDVDFPVLNPDCAIGFGIRRKIQAFLRHKKVLKYATVFSNFFV